MSQKPWKNVSGSRFRPKLSARTGSDLGSGTTMTPLGGLRMWFDSGASRSACAVSWGVAYRSVVCVMLRDCTRNSVFSRHFWSISGASAPKFCRATGRSFDSRTVSLGFWHYCNIVYVLFEAKYFFGFFSSLPREICENNSENNRICHSSEGKKCLKTRIWWGRDEKKQKTYFASNNP